MDFSTVQISIQQFHFAKKSTLFSVCCLFVLFPLFSTSQTLQTHIDKKNILIGEQIQYKVIMEYDPSMYTIRWLNIPDTVPHFEVIHISHLDSVVKKNKVSLAQTITYTSFDSGKWTLPSLMLQIKENKSGSVINLNTDSFNIIVSYAPADSTGQLRDIKPIIQVTEDNYLWYYIIGAALLLLLIGWLTWRYLKKKRKSVSVFKSTLPPYEEAMQELENLSSFDLNSIEQTREYHIRLSFIFKRYCSRITGKHLLSDTTSDMLILLNKADIDKNNIAKAATALRCGDAVKFARFKPSASESEHSRVLLKEVIQYINQHSLTINK